MEEAVVKLIKSCLDNTVKADYGTSEVDDELLVQGILSQASLALRDEARDELVRHVGMLHRPF